MEPDGFYPKYYLELYPDILNAYGWDYSRVQIHYKDRGIMEGRSPNMFFSPHYYESLYPDIQQMAQGDCSKMLQHWVGNGIREGRKGSPIFDASFYLNYYPDLKAAFGNNYYKAYWHWFYQGIKEGRRTVPDVDGPVLLQDMSMTTAGAEQCALSIKPAIDIGKKLIDLLKQPATKEAVKELIDNAQRIAFIVDTANEIRKVVIGDGQNGDERDRDFYRDINRPGAMDLPGQDPSKPVA